ncbi:MAG: General secretion pathway protein K [uncultured bacterium]|nr:MAG: General secretion pathway protein K [uncultured bacterium]OGT33365.1 MAG: hypothetical protein A3C44_04035 [Gammaproteobacteria bacterium RIFCSPHIGHO2_02_FULL_39_13]OGT50306.1 MAG: hypothetical protein A3E53_00960 [Gammaproteobacteria bacterium RIFCSPHIGHO2_12_FULL_39_24]
MRYRRGGALVSALFITAIAAMLATALAVQERLLIHESELVVNADQGYLNLQLMQLIGKNAVKKYAEQWIGQKNLTAQFSPLEINLPPIKLNNTKLTATISDEQGKFNINDLAYSENQNRFVVLLRTVMPAISVEQALAIAKSITAWITTGADDQYYLSLHPAYRSSQAELSDVSELRLIKNITPKIYAVLKPYVTALHVKKPPSTPPKQYAAPTQVAIPVTPININSAEAPVLMTMNTKLTIEQARALESCRKQHGNFSQLKDFISVCGSAAGITDLTAASTTSQYFSVDAQATMGKQVLTLSSLLVTQIEKNNTLDMVTVWQSFE